MPTNQDRIVAFDYLRVIAVLMVMACHWMQFHNVTPVFGSSLGAIANCFFFAMSGLALGLGWRRHGCVGFGKSLGIGMKLLFENYMLNSGMCNMM